MEGNAAADEMTDRSPLIEDEAYDLALRRAEAARNYLIVLGVEQSRPSMISYGATRPIDPRDKPVAHAKNRNVRLFVESASFLDGQCLSARGSK